MDTSALLAVLFAEPERPAVLRCLLGTEQRRMAAPNWLEACMVVDRRDVSQATMELESLVQRLKIDIIPFDARMADRARWAHEKFGKGKHPARLNYGDCMAYATASLFGEPLLFKGSDFSQTDIIPALT